MQIYVQQVVRSSGWKLSEVESMSLEGEGIASLGDSFRGVGKLVYLSLARNSLSSLTVIFSGATAPLETHLIGGLKI